MIKTGTWFLPLRIGQNMELPSFYSTFLRNILRPGNRRKPLAARQSAPVKAAILRNAGLVFLLCNLNSMAAAQAYPLNQLKQDIARFLANDYKKVAHQRIDINVSNLDNRLRLAKCDQPIFTNQDQSGLGGNISVKAQCTGGQPWAVHVPAQVTIYREIPVAGRDIARGEVISQAHIQTSLVNISSIRQEFLPEADAIFGREAKRNIIKGEPFKTALLDAPTVVKRGEIVMLESLAGSIKVSSAATAMVDGRVGQKIRVRNNSSERIISGVVIRQGVVQTL
jgi:flagella basal body P-ring formation protein FlgA